MEENHFLTKMLISTKLLTILQILYPLMLNFIKVMFECIIDPDYFTRKYPDVTNWLRSGLFLHYFEESVDLGVQ